LQRPRYPTAPHSDRLAFARRTRLTSFFACRAIPKTTEFYHRAEDQSVN
jgi:hypothetical protein